MKSTKAERRRDFHSLEMGDDESGSSERMAPTAKRRCHNQNTHLKRDDESDSSERMAPTAKRRRHNQNTHLKRDEKTTATEKNQQQTTANNQQQQPTTSKQPTANIWCSDPCREFKMDSEGTSECSEMDNEGDSECSEMDNEGDSECSEMGNEGAGECSEMDNEGASPEMDNEGATTASIEEYPLQPGTVVWGIYGKRPKRYLGIVIPSIPALAAESAFMKNVFWLGEHSISKVATKNMTHFLDDSAYKKEKNGKWTIPLDVNGLTEAAEVISVQCKITNDIPRSLGEFVLWVQQKERFDDCDYSIPMKFLKKVEEINNRTIQTDHEDGPTKITGDVKTRKFLIPFEERDPKRLCLGCRNVSKKKESHPLLDGFLCLHCFRRVQNNIMTLRINEKHYKYCTICGWLDKHVYCNACKRVICRTCMMFWVREQKCVAAIKEGRWHCIFHLNEASRCNTDTKLVVKESALCEILAVPTTTTFPECDNITFPQSEDIAWPQSRVEIPSTSGGKPALRVLSLFDGIGSGLLALKSLGIKVEKYFASEIDNEAIQVSKYNHGDNIEHIGDIKDITSITLKKYLPIHLLIGGSPCNELSRVNHNRKGLSDISASGVLVFEFSRILKLIDDTQEKPRKFFFLFENVASMDIEDRKTITRFFEVSPICIDSKSLTAMSRSRLFWGNIPEMARLAKGRVEDSPSVLQDHLMPNLKREATVKKIRTVTTNKNSLVKNNGQPQVEMDGKPSTLAVTEIEKIFGFPEHYTDVMNLTPGTRQRLLGKAWCINVVKSLFQPLKEMFEVEEEIEVFEVEEEIEVV